MDQARVKAIWKDSLELLRNQPKVVSMTQDGMILEVPEFGDRPAILFVVSWYVHGAAKDIMSASGEPGTAAPSAK